MNQTRAQKVRAKVVKKKAPKAAPVATREYRDGPEITMYQAPDPWQDSFWNDRQMRMDAAEEMAAVYTLAVANMGVLGTHLSDACEAFKNFAEKKISDMDTDDIRADMLKGVFSFSLDLIKGLLPGSDAMSKLSKFLYEKIQDGVKSLLELPMKNIGEVDTKALKKAMTDLAEAGRKLKMQWYTSTPGGEAKQQIVPLQRLSGVVSRLQANLKANNRKGMDMDEWEFLETFLSTEVDERDALLDHLYGVPSSKTSRLIALNLYKGIARRFAKVYGWSAADKVDQINKSQNQPSRVNTLEAQCYSDAIMAYLP